ncbi:MAG TPA: GNAT family N-acetyltransferase [Solirubrobacterales bacterium]|nr:GNAT family N-acetyltransferase [Solirubrobacterales bacterium]
MDGEPILRTRRLSLRRWRYDDAAELAEIDSDPEVTRYLNPPVTPAARFTERCVEHWEKHGFGFFAVELHEEPTPGRFIGFVGIGHPAFLPELAARPELGWRLARDAWGRGLATEAAVAVCEDAFGRLGLDELISIIHPENAASRRVATKVGMRIEGEVHHPGLDRDVDVWQLTAPAAA